MSPFLWTQFQRKPLKGRGRLRWGAHLENIPQPRCEAVCAEVTKKSDQKVMVQGEHTALTEHVGRCTIMQHIRLHGARARSESPALEDGAGEIRELSQEQSATTLLALVHHAPPAQRDFVDKEIQGGSVPADSCPLPHGAAVEACPYFIARERFSRDWRSGLRCGSLSVWRAHGRPESEGGGL